MTALRAVATYLPAHRIPIEDLAGKLDLTPIQVKMFRRYHGLSQVAADPGGTLLDLLRGATEALSELRGRERQVRYVVYARAFPVVAPYPENALDDLCRAIGLDHAIAFTVTHQSCASGLLAIDVAGRLIDADDSEDPLALVLAGEKAFTYDSQLLPGTSIFGEGAAACLVGRDGPRDRLLAYACDVRGEYDGELSEVAAGFQREYRTLLTAVIRTALDRAGTTIRDIAAILPHNVNLVSWQRLCRALGFPIGNVVLDNVGTLGHVYCADAFVNHRTALARGLLKPGDRYLVVATGAGHGATFSAMVFEH